MSQVMSLLSFTLHIPELDLLQAATKLVHRPSHSLATVTGGGDMLPTKYYPNCTRYLNVLVFKKKKVISSFYETGFR